MFRRRTTVVSERYTRLCADDLQVIAALESHGADLEAPRHVLHYVQVANREIADRAARLGGRWLTTVTDPGSPGEGWFVIFERHDRVLTPVHIMADRSLFENMAEVHQGIYDGWEVSL